MDIARRWPPSGHRGAAAWRPTPDLSGWRCGTPAPAPRREVGSPGSEPDRAPDGRGMQYASSSVSRLGRLTSLIITDRPADGRPEFAACGLAFLREAASGGR